MTTFRTFEDIDAWKESRVLIKKIREICKRSAVRRDFVLVDQITRASRSIAANIAEGNDALSVPQFITFLGYAKRSAAEVRAHLYDLIDEQYITNIEFEDLAISCRKIARMLSKLISYLETVENDRK